MPAARTAAWADPKVPDRFPTQQHRDHLVGLGPRVAQDPHELGRRGLRGGRAGRAPSRSRR